MISKTENNELVIVFEGDILVSCCYKNEAAAKVIFGEIPKEEQHGEIGDLYPEFDGKSSADLINPIVMIFTNPLSIDVVIEKLNQAKAQLL